MTGNWTAPELTPEQQRADELKAQGLRRSSWDGRVERIPEPPKLVTPEELEAGWAKIREEARINTAAREEAERAERAAAAAEVATVAADKQAAWLRYQALAGRNADGGLVADYRLFDETWQRHLAQRAIAESAAAGPG
ncbi:MAG: hypothetical protein WAV79_22395 [Anaerolineae bacterium]